MQHGQELVVVTKTYDLILWSCHHTSRFPRNHRFVLGERIEHNLYDLNGYAPVARFHLRRPHLATWVAVEHPLRWPGGTEGYHFRSSPATSESSPMTSMASLAAAACPRRVPARNMESLTPVAAICRRTVR